MPADRGEAQFETSLEHGLERVDCRPASRTHKTPILFLHGMWHGAWCATAGMTGLFELSG